MRVDVRYNTLGKYNMFGNLITQQWARDALPVIVAHAKLGKVIYLPSETVSVASRRGFQVFHSSSPFAQ